ncbi:hypothetical protein PG996_002924 [Apiospora saccharicola]|uniref:Uncharacterized protein n=1 Tax=Apiospora saccharicola TaxID=335842 RepID=A0ABR1WL09_9PEZI
MQDSTKKFPTTNHHDVGNHWLPPSSGPTLPCEETVALLKEQLDAANSAKTGWMIFGNVMLVLAALSQGHKAVEVRNTASILFAWCRRALALKGKAKDKAQPEAGDLELGEEANTFFFTFAKIRMLFRMPDEVIYSLSIGDPRV